MFYQIIIALLLMLLAAGPAIAAEPSPFARDIGDHGYIDDGDWACPSLGDEAEYDRLIRENDAEAAIKFEQRECVPLDDGTEVVVEKTEPWYYLDTHGYICVRPVGQPTNCGWILPGSVTKIKCTKENWRQHPYCVAGHSITPYLHSPVDDPGR